MWDLPRHRTCVPCIGRWILKHCATGEVSWEVFIQADAEWDLSLLRGETAFGVGFSPIFLQVQRLQSNLCRYLKTVNLEKLFAFLGASLVVFSTRHFAKAKLKNCMELAKSLAPHLHLLWLGVTFMNWHTFFTFKQIWKDHIFLHFGKHCSWCFWSALLFLGTWSLSAISLLS